jgi:hypothetical protein
MKLNSYNCESAYDRPDYQRLVTASLGRSAVSRATIAGRLLLDRHTDCRAFDNCFEMGDADKVIALLVQTGLQNEPLRSRIRESWSSTLDAEGWPKGWLDIYSEQMNPLHLAA